jgi:DNA-binding MarR family transcriptional regulator
MLKAQMATLRHTQKELDIDAPGLEVMMHLNEHGECNPSELAKAWAPRPQQLR